MLKCLNEECETILWVIPVEAYWRPGGAQCLRCGQRGEVAWSGSWNRIIQQLFSEAE